MRNKTGAIEEVPMTIIGGFDLHRAQITFDYLDTETGEVNTGQIRPATRVALRTWLNERFSKRDDVALAVEGCTGWRFVVEEMQRVGVEPHLAEPADTASQRGPKKRAKTDKADARLLRDLLCQERLPESWIPPQHLLEVRTLGRLYLSLAAERRAWLQRIHAQLYHQGVLPVRVLLTCEGRGQLAAAELSPAGRQMVQTALSMVQALDQQLEPLRAQLRSLSYRLPGTRALKAQYGIGPLSAVIIWAELGDCRRFSSSDQAVRLSGLDVSVWSSDSKRSPGLLARQGPPALRWALFEAAKCAARPRSPDHAYYHAVSERLSSKRSTLSVARKLARRCYHTLRELGEDALAPADEPETQAA
jgi:transposase